MKQILIGFIWATTLIFSSYAIYAEANVGYAIGTLIISLVLALVILTNDGTEKKNNESKDPDS